MKAYITSLRRGGARGETEEGFASLVLSELEKVTVDVTINIFTRRRDHDLDYLEHQDILRAVMRSSVLGSRMWVCIAEGFSFFSELEKVATNAAHRG